MRRLSLILALMLVATASPVLAQDGEGGDTGASGSNEMDRTTFRWTVLRDLSGWRRDEARELLAEQKTTFGKTTDYTVADALILAQERKLDKAVTALREAVEADTDDPSAPYFLGEVLSWKKNEGAEEQWRTAKKRAKAILENDKKNPWALFWQGAALIRLGDYQMAEGKLKKALANGSDPAMTEFQLGLARMYREKWGTAREAFDRCIEADGGYAHAYYYRGRVWEKLGNTEKMLLDMDRFLALAPDAREANAARSILRSGG